MTIDELKELLDEFLNRWAIEGVQNLTLQEYVGLGNKDTFCQWVETKTRMLGSIKGLTSIKFGIYERKDPNKKPKNYKMIINILGYKVMEMIEQQLLKIQKVTL